MFDTGADPVQASISVVDLCLKGIPTGKEVLPAIFVTVAITPIRKELQSIFAMGRVPEIKKFLVEGPKGFQQVLCLVPEEQAIRVIRFWAHLCQGSVIAGKAGLGQECLGSSVDVVEAFKNVVKIHDNILCLFTIIIEDIKRQCRSGHVGGRKKDVPGPMDLHELSRKSCQ